MKRLICILLCICFIFGFAFNAPDARAMAPALVIGGSMVISLATAATISLIAANATGMSQNIIDKAAADNVSANGLMQTLIQDYANARFKRVTDILSLINAGTNIVSSGEVTFNGSLSEFYSDFLSWAHSSEGGNLIEYDQTGSSTEGTISTDSVQSNDYDFSFIGSAVPISNTIYATGNSTAYLFPIQGSCLVASCMTSSNSVTFTCCSFSPFTLTRQDNAGEPYGTWNGSRSVFADDEEYYYLTISLQIRNFNSWTPQSFNLSGGYSAQALCYLMLHGQVSSGTSSVNTGIYDLPSNKDTNVLDVPSVISVPDYGSIQDIQGKTDVQQWLDATSDVIYQGAGSIAIEDDLGVVTEYPVGLADVGDITVTQTTAEAIEETIEGTDTTYQPVGSGTATDEVTEDFSIDLRDFFPFCIPFDIYAMLSLFSGAPEAPDVEWRFYVPGIIDETIELDLSIFDPVAAVLRNVELIAFGIFLAYNSKKILFGS